MGFSEPGANQVLQITPTQTQTTRKQRGGEADTPCNTETQARQYRGTPADSQLLVLNWDRSLIRYPVLGVPLVLWPV